ncbi:MAG: hypothetical protein AAGD47_12445, partial [Pseudomonadota bacterium]
MEELLTIACSTWNQVWTWLDDTSNLGRATFLVTVIVPVGAFLGWLFSIIRRKAVQPAAITNESLTATMRSMIKAELKKRDAEVEEQLKTAPDEELAQL